MSIKLKLRGHINGSPVIVTYKQNRDQQGKLVEEHLSSASNTMLNGRRVDAYLEEHRDRLLALGRALCFDYHDGASIDVDFESPVQWNLPQPTLSSTQRYAH